MRPIDRFLPDPADIRQRVNVLSLGPNLQFDWGQAARSPLELRWIDSRAENGDQLESQRLSAALHAVRDLDSTSSRSEEHTSELQSLMRISYAVFCLKKKTSTTQQKHDIRIKTAMPPTNRLRR